ncbi:MAG TPA: nucleotidyltransferase domain-containing protein [Sumerlaeia bacterium]|nr:nucleotidyltransferase domain-containing protein [Sumerlaeia bacterium]
MTKFDLDNERTNQLSRAVDFLTGFEEVIAVGVSGSSATGTRDDLSDLDVCVFTDPNLPEPKLRRERLESSALGEITHFDVDFGVSRGDGVSLRGKPCDFNWMTVPGVASFLESLAVDFDCGEFVPGGLLMTQSVYDPQGIIEHLQEAVPEYSRERAMHRIEKSISSARSLLYGFLRLLDKAVARDDYFSYLRFQYELLDKFFTALYAANRQWFCDEKRLVEDVDKFAYAPSRAKDRLTQITRHSGKCSSLADGLEEIKSLFAELVCLSLKMYPELELPTEWN